MHSFIRREGLFFAFIFLSLLLSPVITAGPVGSEQARKAADTFLRTRIAQSRKGFEPLSVKAEAGPTGFREIRGDDGTVLAYVTELEPGGFIATSADTQIDPIIAYSFRNPFPSENDRKNPLLRMLKEDMRLRAKALAEYDRFDTAENTKLWNLYAGEDAQEPEGETFQQWPGENTTFTGGWIETVWDQSEPFNNFCPLDPVDANRAYVGCVATAMAQVINYHKICEAQFDEDDSFTTFSGIDFDGDSEIYDFPTFEELNEYLAAIRSKYDSNADLNDMDFAALSFACGVAIQMDYSSEGSGASPFDMREALLDKFGFYSADMMGGLSPESYLMLQESMINGLPALLSISSPDNWGGHLIVCDGYNTNGEFHLNYGWGSEHPEAITEVWYRLPQNLSSDLSIVTEIVTNLRPAQPDIEVEPATLSFYAAPGQESESQALYIENSVGGLLVNSISSSEGFVFARWGGTYSNRMEYFQLEGPGSRTSIYVKFSPGEARGYYGILTINYSDGKSKSMILKGTSFEGGTEIPAGEVSGTWTRDESPYYVSGDISVPEDNELVIEPGVRIFFTGPYGMTIGENAQLTAEGNENNPIEFTAWNKQEGWIGLRFIDSGGDDILNHCHITFSRKNTGMIPAYQTYGQFGDADSCGGAIYCSFSDPIISNCKITNNTGDRGGAIYCTESYPVISNTLIANNASMGGDPQCGGICIDAWGEPEIINCTIVNNIPGGIFTQTWDGIDVTNTILWGNDRYQILTQESTARVSFSNVQDGYDGEGNIDADPCFLDPSAGAGTEHDGLTANWMLQSSSPCINSGRQVNLHERDLAGNPRMNSDIIDIGAYENQSELPLITIIPSVTCDAGFAQLDSDSTISFDIMNTGMLEFDIERLSVQDAKSVFSIVTPLENHLLPPGDSVMVDIGFKPVEEKIYTDTLDIHSSSSNAPIKRVYLRGVGVTGTLIPGGEVRDTWTKADSPYTISGDIHIPRGRKLTIEPGVVVKFAGHFKFTVGYRATLIAIGTEDENIIFTATDIEEGWFGLRFVNSGDDDRLEYCTIEYSKKPRTEGGGYENTMGGAILCCSSWEAEPGYFVPSSPTIDHCTIANNDAEFGGGIMLTDDSEAVVTNSRIVDNSADLAGGGFYIVYGGGTIANNIIAHNEAGIIGGGLMTWLGYPSIFNNTIVHNRPSGLSLDMTPWYPWEPEYGLNISNNIIWQNEIYLEEGIDPDEYDIRYNNIQGGWEGEGNIDVDPLFVDPENRDYHLRSEAGHWDPVSQSWIVDEKTSPCIDAGDPESPFDDEPKAHGDRINMGAYGGTAQASKSL